ncbi:hypothetical protein KIPB_015136, partial [Kipferlia bialata]|eukprot:g15136.t1
MLPVCPALQFGYSDVEYLAYE